MVIQRNPTSVHPPRGILVFFALLFGGFGCSLFEQEDPPPPPDPTQLDRPDPTVQADDEEPSALEVIRRSLSGNQPCPVGYWEAEDFLGAIREALLSQKEVAGAELTQAGGTLTLAFAPPEDGSGVLTVQANSVRHTMRSRMRGLRATFTHEMNGTAVVPYSLPSDGRIRLQDPTQNDIRARVSMNLTRGFGFDRQVDTPFDVEGNYRYSCEQDKMTIHRGSADEYDIVLTRISEEEFQAASVGQKQNAE